MNSAPTQPGSPSPAPSAPPPLAQSDRLHLLELMARARLSRRRMAEDRSSRRMAALTGIAEPGWEALEAGVAHSLQPGDALVATAAWAACGLDDLRVGSNWRVVGAIAAGFGAALAAPAGSLAAVLADERALQRGMGTLELAASRDLPVLVAVAALGEAADSRETVERSGLPHEVVEAADVEHVAAAAARLADGARSGGGPGILLGLRTGIGLGGLTDEHDPVPAYAKRLGELGIPLDSLRELARSVRRTL